MKRTDINWDSIEVDGINMRDYPDFCDAYACYAEFTDGTPLDDEQLDKLNDEFFEVVYERIIDNQLYL